MGQNAKRRREARASSRRPGLAGRMSPLGNRHARRHPLPAMVVETPAGAPTDDQATGEG